MFSSVSTFQSVTKNYNKTNSTPILHWNYSTNDISKTFINPASICCNYNCSVVYISSYNGYIYQSINSGISWSNILSTAYTTQKYPVYLTCDTNVGNILYFTSFNSTSNTWKTYKWVTDTSFTNVSPVLTDLSMNMGCVATNSSGNFLLGTSYINNATGYINYSSDGGSSFTTYSTSFINNSIFGNNYWAGPGCITMDNTGTYITICGSIDASNVDLSYNNGIKNTYLFKSTNSGVDFDCSYNNQPISNFPLSNNTSKWSCCKYNYDGSILVASIFNTTDTLNSNIFLSYDYGYTWSQVIINNMVNKIIGVCNTYGYGNVCGSAITINLAGSQMIICGLNDNYIAKQTSGVNYNFFLFDTLYILNNS